MGWTFNTHPQRKADFIQDCLREIIRDSNYKILKHKCHGNELWLLLEPPGRSPLIGLFLLDKRKGCWGYKDMAEADHPYYYRCPLEYLDLAPVTNQDWRNQVLAIHAPNASFGS